MIKYDKMWTTMEEKGVTKYRLRKEYHISKAQLDRLQRNESVTTNTVDRLCNILSCDICDVMGHTHDNNPFRPLGNDGLSSGDKK